MAPFRFNYLWKDPTSQGHILSSWGLGIQQVNLAVRRHSSAHNAPASLLAAQSISWPPGEASGSGILGAEPRGTGKWGGGFMERRWKLWEPNDSLNSCPPGTAGVRPEGMKNRGVVTVPNCPHLPQPSNTRSRVIPQQAHEVGVVPPFQR